MREEKKPKGRPRKADGPKFPQAELEKLLVHGEVVECEGGGGAVVYPPYRELAKRYGVSHSVISAFARKHNCGRRREEAKLRVAVRADEKVIEMRAHAIAVSTADEIRIIDTYILGFEKAMAEDRVRFDDPGYFNQMVRLKQFKLGGPDTRQEVRGLPTLEDMQRRHREMLRRLDEATPAMRGVEVGEGAAGKPIDRIQVGTSQGDGFLEGREDFECDGNVCPVSQDDIPGGEEAGAQS